MNISIADSNIPTVVKDDKSLGAAVEWVTDLSAKIALLESMRKGPDAAIRAYMELNELTEYSTAKAQVAVSVGKDLIARTKTWTEAERIESMKRLLGSEAKDMILEEIDQKLLMKKLGKSAAARTKYTEMGFEFRKGPRKYEYSEVASL